MTCGKEDAAVGEPITFPFEEKLAEHGIKSKTAAHIRQLFDAFGVDRVFGRTDVIEELGLTPSPASTLIKKMLDADIVIPVSGAGKGKARFNEQGA